MKSIEVTTLQRDKLIAMASVLFPNLDFSFRYGREPNQAIGFHIDGGSFTEIHWFEFCMCYLAGKLTDGVTFYEFCSRCSAQKNLDLKWEGELSDRLFMHPIDYLFDKFQKRTS